MSKKSLDQIWEKIQKEKALEEQKRFERERQLNPCGIILSMSQYLITWDFRLLDISINVAIIIFYLFTMWVIV